MSTKWKMTKISELADVKVGFVGKITNHYVDSGVPIIRSKDIVAYSILEDQLLEVSQEFHNSNSKSSLSPGDVVVVRTGKPGTACVIPNHITDSQCLDAVIVRCNPERLLPDYYCAFMNSLGSHYVHSTIVGAVQQHFNVKVAKDMRIPLPSIMKQKRLVSIFNSLNDASENISKTNKLSEKLIQTFFRSWFIDFDPVRAKVEGKLPYGMNEETAALFPDSFEDSELGPVPAGWRIHCMADVADVLLGGTPSRDCDNFWGETGIPWINSGETRNLPINTPSEYITEEGYNNSSTKLIPPRTTVVAITGTTLGQISFTSIECCTNQSIVAIVGNDVVPSEFIFPLFNIFSNHLKMLQTGGAQPHINRKDISSFRFVLPPENVIKEYVSDIKQLFDILDMSAAKITNLKSTKDALLPRLMSGELEI